ncbi:MAG: hypothetical protein PHT12_04455 [Patescibacteria group bacterium]|nr:hypothetical protein [Patescibacteria group bacterium]
MKDMSAVVEEILAEREGNQFAKWPPGPEFAEYKARSFSLWLLMVEEYVARARRELTDKPGREAAVVQLRKALNLGLWALQIDENVD